MEGCLGLMVGMVGLYCQLEGEAGLGRFEQIWAGKCDRAHPTGVSVDMRAAAIDNSGHETNRADAGCGECGLLC